MTTAIAAGTEGLFPLSAVIVNWNLPSDTACCVESLLAGAPPVPDVILVDNGSDDDSVRRLRGRFGGSITIIRNEKNLGFAGGANAGIRHALAAGARSVLLLNNDTVVAPDMLAHLVSAAAGLPRAGMLAPVIRHYYQPRRVWGIGDRECRWLPVPLKLGRRALRQAGGKPFAVDYVTACGVLVRSTLFKEVGLFDTSYFMYFEDADLCRRAREGGFGIWCVPAATMWHKVSQTARKDKPASRYALSWGRARFHMTHPHGVFPRAVWAYLFLKASLITLQDMASGQWGTIKPLWAGTWDGCLRRPSHYPDGRPHPKSPPPAA